MAMPSTENADMNLDGSGDPDVGDGEIMDLSQLTDKGYDYTRGAGAAFTGKLQGSVAKQNWTDIVALAATGQGSISAQYNYVKAVFSVAGAIGTDTVIKIAGKVL